MNRRQLLRAPPRGKRAPRRRAGASKPWTATVRHPSLSRSLSRSLSCFLSLSPVHSPPETRNHAPSTIPPKPYTICLTQHTIQSIKLGDGVVRAGVDKATWKMEFNLSWRKTALIKSSR